MIGLNKPENWATTPETGPPDHSQVLAPFEKTNRIVRICYELLTRQRAVQPDAKIRS